MTDEFRKALEELTATVAEQRSIQREESRIRGLLNTNSLRYERARSAYEAALAHEMDLACFVAVPS